MHSLEFKSCIHAVQDEERLFVTRKKNKTDEIAKNAFPSLCYQ